MYQIAGRDVLFAWLARESDPERRLGLLERLADLASDPTAWSDRVPGICAPVYIAVISLRHQAVVVTFLLAEQFRTVKLIKIEDFP